MKYIITESQYGLIRENKNKKFLTKVMGQDFTDKIKMITSTYDVPMSFDEGVGPNLINRWLNNWSPMYLVNVKGKDYLYQNRGDFEMFIDEEGYDSVDDEIPEELGVSELGLKFSDIINMFYDEEKSPNMSADDKKIKFMENLVKDSFSDYDWYEGVDTTVESYTFRNPEYSVPLYVFYLMSNDRLQANIDLIEYENGDDDIDEMFSSLFPKDNINDKFSALYVIRVA